MIRIIAERQQDFHTVARLLLVSPYLPFLSFSRATTSRSARDHSRERKERATSCVANAHPSFRRCIARIGRRCTQGPRMKILRDSNSAWQWITVCGVITPPYNIKTQVWDSGTPFVFFFFVCFFLFLPLHVDIILTLSKKVRRSP